MLEIQIAELSITRLGHCIILVHPGREQVVPIFIGPLESYAINIMLEGIKPERPLTHDLFASALQAMNVKVEKVFIDDFRDGTFYAKLFLYSKKDGKSYVLDARPSDSIALALRFQAPIYMAEHVYDQAGIDALSLMDKRSEQESPETLSPEEESEFVVELEEAFSGSEERGEEPDLPEEEGQFLTKRQALEKMLKAAIQREDYEEAARLRDEIRQLAEEEGKENQ
ncbi:MAG: DUF151 domain-containing protein [Leptospiraceae bacterium]|nr:DUF151 domain-containing protein [Leptospiraceae bacterium]MDW8306328.1 DUF151 domain-containing protein [Leptospiraceae bacterium]